MIRKPSFEQWPDFRPAVLPHLTTFQQHDIEGRFILNINTEFFTYGASYNPKGNYAAKTDLNGLTWITYNNNNNIKFADSCKKIATEH